MKTIKFLAVCLFCMICLCPASAEEYAEGEAIVVFEASEAVQASVEVVGASVSDTYEALSNAGGKVFVRVKSSAKTTEELIAELKQMPGVIAVSPNRIHHKPFSALPNESESGNDNTYYDRIWGLERIKAPEAWDITTGSDSVYVAVIDSGVYLHPDLEANIAEDLAPSGWQNDTVGHGTHIAGTIGAVGNNGIGIAGVNWSVKIIPLNVTNANGDVSDGSVLNALNYIVRLIQEQRVNIAAVNLSFGGYYSITPEEAENETYYQAYKILDNLNKTILVVASGNEGLEVGVPAPFTQPAPLMSANGLTKPMFSKGDYTYPASFTGLHNMIVVGATDENDNAPGFTNWGSRVDIAAPGKRIFSTYSPLVKDSEGKPGNIVYASKDGTSMAVPHVTGAVALLKSAFPNASTAEIRNAIISGADKKINPTVYPYTNQVNELDENDEDYARIVDALEPYQELNNKGTVSRSGLLNIKAAMDILSMKGNRDDVGTIPETSGCGISLGGIALLSVLALISSRKRG